MLNKGRYTDSIDLDDMLYVWLPVNSLIDNK